MVTVLIREPEVPGRILVYCPRCRKNVADKVDVNLPLAEVDVKVFVRLYQDGKTGSAPDTAAEIVFGEALPDAVQGAEEALFIARSP